MVAPLSTYIIPKFKSFVNILEQIFSGGAHCVRPAHRIFDHK